MAYRDLEGKEENDFIKDNFTNYIVITFREMTDIGVKNWLNEGYHPAKSE